ncbi:CBS domain-containing protein [Varunaivibrio sulfuroxidans]|uniref:CBS domain protein n=1 Tax=Varunaivibrio sulfuroxidans TaxID=1773489 RepID=A0A4R3J8U7_9PROT|nr:CBS domain-containing protein [Varunaivibrio sulfuroxidans]TCS61366.1 CBS domain protein [Varunaivibrio sulfuroxidans]WES31022.1 CBS domain-containing protein [Varunaivibrio sulfuroxidans]
MFVQDILKSKGSEVVAVSSDATAADVARLFRDNRIGFATVHRYETAGPVIGTISERDIVQALARLNGEVATTKVAALMTTNIVTCAYGDTAETIMELMTERRTRHVLVYDGSRLMGLLSIGDMLKHRLEEMMMTEESMRQYISGGTYN